MKKYRTEISALIDAQPTTMSKYQIDNFVINDKITPYKILKQILLELGTRYPGLDNLKIDLEIEKLKLKKLEEQYSTMLESIDKQILEQEIKKQNLVIASSEKTLHNYEYEIEILENNYKKLEEQYEPKELLMDEQGEEVYWTNKFIKEAQIDIMTDGRIGKGILDAILMLDDEKQKLIINNAVAQAAASNYYISASENNILQNLKNITPTLMLNETIKKV